MMSLLLVLHFLVCFVLIAVVLLQRGKGADLGAALGGGGANTIFGGRGAGNFLTKLTTGSAIIFMFTSLSLAYLGSQNADVQLFGDADVEADESAPAGLAPAAAQESPTAAEGDLGGGLEEIQPGDLGDDEGTP